MSKGGMTALAYLNFFIIQWFCVRLCRVYDDGKYTGWGLIGFVVPLTGWWSYSKWIWRRSGTSLLLRF